MEANAQHGYGEEHPNADCHCPDQYLVGNRGHLICQYLQIRLRDGDNRPYYKTNEDDGENSLPLAEFAADALPKRRHGHLSAQLEQPYAYN